MMAKQTLRLWHKPTCFMLLTFCLLNAFSAVTAWGETARFTSAARPSMATKKSTPLAIVPSALAKTNVSSATLSTPQTFSFYLSASDTDANTHKVVPSFLSDEKVNTSERKIKASTLPVTTSGVPLSKAERDDIAELERHLRQQNTSSLNTVPPTSVKETEPLLAKPLAKQPTSNPTATSPAEKPASSNKVLSKQLVLEGGHSAVGSKSTTPQVGLLPATMPVNPNAAETFRTELLQPAGAATDLTLSLPEVVNLALQHSLGLLIANVQSKQALAFKKEAYGDFLPNLLLSFRYSDFDGGIQIFTGEPVRAKISTLLPEARINLPINVGGAALFKLKARDRNYLLKQFAEQVVTQDTLLEVSDTYINLLNRYLEMSLIEQSKQEAEAQLALSQARFDEGLGILLEVLESKNQVQQQQQRSLEAKQALKEANYRLNTYLGFTPEVSIVPTLTSVTELNLYQNTETLDSLLAFALAHEPNVKQAQARSESRRAAYRQVIAEAFPTLNLNAFFNGIGKRFDGLQTTRYHGIELTFNALEGLGVKPYQKIQQAKLEWQEAELAVEQQQRKVREQVASAFIAFQTSEKRVDVSKERLAISERSREQANGRYEAGLGNYLEVLSAATSLQQARNQYVATLLSYKRNQLALARQVGDLKNRLLALLPVGNAPTANNTTAP
jgi:outer membrane protein